MALYKTFENSVAVAVDDIGNILLAVKTNLEHAVK